LGVLLWWGAQPPHDLIADFENALRAV
jgi:hypothetical protein